MLEQVLTDFYQDLIQAFSEPKKRVFWGYLLCSLVIAICWLKWSQVRFSSVLFSKKIWWSESAKTDYLIFLINRFAFLFIAPLLVTQLAVATWLFQSMHEWIGYRPLIGEDWPAWAIMGLFTVCYFLLDDFSRFFVHKLLHEVPALWAFHKVHHSARSLTPITVFRTHPVEGVLFSLRSTLVQAISIAFFVFFFGKRADLITVLGAGIFTFLFNLTGSNLRHSHIALGYWHWLEKWLISPAQHQIHHSTKPAHFDKNYGVVLSIWDRITGTLVYSEKGQQLEFGLSRQRLPDEQNLIKIYTAPFFELGSVLLSKIRKKSKEAPNS
ncbi:MAG: sterol desaturase family protein [Neptuniibacter sp.]|nr:sterol desaturase family protein [Neptuniibacter sp.]